MRTACVGQVVAFALLLGGCVSAPTFSGPLPVRNQHPAQLTVLHMAPADTSVLDAGSMRLRADAAYSSLFLAGSDGGDSFEMDGEYLLVTPTWQAGLGEGLELAVSVPVAHTSGGFLDAFVIDYHDTFGFPDQGRSQTANNQFEIEATKNGQDVWGVDESSFELMDVPLELTWQAVAPDADTPGLALRGAIELPVGDDAAGYGSGEVDYSFGLLVEQRWREVAFYGHAQHTLAGTPSRTAAAGLSFEDVTSVGLTAELPLLENFAALVQAEYETSTLRGIPIPEASDDQLLLWVGGRWRLSTGAIEIGFGEDLQGYVSPDFTAWLGFTTGPF